MDRFSMVPAGSIPAAPIMPPKPWKRTERCADRGLQYAGFHVVTLFVEAVLIRYLRPNPLRNPL